MFTCSKTGEQYIGSAISMSALYARFKSHITNSNYPGPQGERGGNNPFYTFVRNVGGWSHFT